MFKRRRKLLAELEELHKENAHLRERVEVIPSMHEFDYYKSFHKSFSEERNKVRESVANYICYLLEIPEEGSKSHKDISRIKLLCETYEKLTQPDLPRYY